MLDRIEGKKRVAKRFFGTHGEIRIGLDAEGGGTGSLVIDDQQAALRIEQIPTPPGQPLLIDFSFAGDGFSGRGSASILNDEEGRRIEGRLFPTGGATAAFSGRLTAER